LVEVEVSVIAMPQVVVVEVEEEPQVREVLALMLREVVPEVIQTVKQEQTHHLQLVVREVEEVPERH
jgi:hypothetical protein